MEKLTRLSPVGLTPPRQRDGPDDRFGDYPEIERAADHHRTGIVKGRTGFVPSPPVDLSSDELRQVVKFAAESQ